jgi:hypothetical protein
MTWGPHPIGGTFKVGILQLMREAKLICTLSLSSTYCTGNQQTVINFAFCLLDLNSAVSCSRTNLFSDDHQTVINFTSCLLEKQNFCIAMQTRFTPSIWSFAFSKCVALLEITLSTEIFGSWLYLANGHAGPGWSKPSQVRAFGDMARHDTEMKWDVPC